MKKSHKDTLTVWADKIEKVKKAKSVRHALPGYKLSTGEVISFGFSSCPLCEEYSDYKARPNSVGCGGCPIAGGDPKCQCKNTPYHTDVLPLLEVIDAGGNPIRTLEKAMIKEYKYLQKVLGDTDSA